MPTLDLWTYLLALQSIRKGFFLDSQKGFVYCIQNLWFILY